MRSPLGLKMPPDPMAPPGASSRVGGWELGWTKGLGVGGSWAVQVAIVGAPWLLCMSCSYGSMPVPQGWDQMIHFIASQQPTQRPNLVPWCCNNNPPAAASWDPRVPAPSTVDSRSNTADALHCVQTRKRWQVRGQHTQTGDGLISAAVGSWWRAGQRVGAAIMCRTCSIRPPAPASALSLLLLSYTLALMPASSKALASARPPTPLPMTTTCVFEDVMLWGHTGIAWLGRSLVFMAA